MRIKKRHPFKFVVVFLAFIVVAGFSWLGFQFVTKTGLFRIPGIIYYDESLTEDEIALLNTVFTEDVVLENDVHVSGSSDHTRLEPRDNTFLTGIDVPVADFYDVRSDISEFESDEFEYIPIEELNFNKKLLSIDQEYFLDSFNTGALFRSITFDSESFSDEILPLVESLFSHETFPDKNSVLTFAQTGVTALSRGMNQKLKAVGNGNYFAEMIGDYLSGFDITHTSNESSFSKFASSENICSDARFKDTLTAIGLDIVELTGNHNQDCGIDDAASTIDYYREAGIEIVGGGKNADEAAIPLEIDDKGAKITFLAYNLSTGGATHGNTPGANQYYEENAIQEINAAKERGDFILIDVQYYECSGYASEYEDTTCDYANSAAGDQVGFFRHLIDLGADMVVGTSAHQPQTFELYNDGVIYYGLGNLFFDQVWWPGTTRSLILAHYFYNNQLLQTKIVPTVYDKNLQTSLMDEETRRWFINRLLQARP